LYEAVVIFVIIVVVFAVIGVVVVVVFSVVAGVVIVVIIAKSFELVVAVVGIIIVFSDIIGSCDWLGLLSCQLSVQSVDLRDIDWLWGDVGSVVVGCDVCGVSGMTVIAGCPSSGCWLLKSAIITRMFSFKTCRALRS